ncbi:RNA-guided endonuclease InsQ/TnpB family protein [Burkholderia vietnamiensis]|uniref:RNA-guided endonuclease InsQ/TnpB family protein n=1 Tax=Burkholderia vietnamiensis TaxID=60552 RepID=UPI001CF47A97|nr:transposase [Burkholderia vietnamiensis]MCA8448944.1 transposase [Burkholderia vietnamiensis]
MTTASPSQRSKRVKKPKHSVETRSYKFPLETNEKQNFKLFDTLDLCLEVRNTLVREREENRVQQRQNRIDGKPAVYLTRSDQYKRVSELRKDDVRLRAVHSHVLQNVAQRVDAGTKLWLNAIKTHRRGVKPPGPLDRKHYHSFTYPEYGNGCKVKQGRLHLSFLGDFRLLAHRRMRGLTKTVTITFEDGRWWVVITCALQEKDVIRFADHPDVQDLPDTGADTGLQALLTTAHGEVFDPPKAFKRAQDGLCYAQRDMSRKFEMRKRLYAEEQIRRRAAGEDLQPPLRELPLSNRLKRSIQKVAKRHTQVKNQRKDAHRKIARRIEQTYRRVGVEEHGVKFMLKNRRLAKAAMDRGIYAFKQSLKAILGERYVPVPNFRPGIGGNSQTCVCGASVPKDLSTRVHDCPSCGLKDNRDVVSANIAMLIGLGSTAYPKQYQEQDQQEADGLSASAREETEDRRVLPPVESAKASEVSVKREPRVTVKHQDETGDGKPAPVTKTPRHRNRPKVKPLPGEGVLGVPLDVQRLYGSPSLQAG